MAGISDKTLKWQYAENKFRFNKGNELQNREFADGSGLEMYDAMHRTYDPQLGRFMQIDPKSNQEDQESWTPYHFGFDSPAEKNDPDGECPNCVTAALGALIEGGIELGSQLASGKSWSQIDWADVGVEATKGAITGFAPGLGTAVRIGMDVTGEVIKAGIDVSAEQGVQTVVNGTKSWGSAGVDLTVNLAANFAYARGVKALGKAASKTAAAANNAASKAASKQAKALYKAVTGASAKSTNYAVRKAAVASSRSASAKAKAAVLRAASKAVSGKGTEKAAGVAKNVIVNKADDGVKTALNIKD